MLLLSFLLETNDTFVVFNFFPVFYPSYRRDILMPLRRIGVETKSQRGTSDLIYVFKYASIKTEESHRDYSTLWFLSVIIP